MKSRHGWSIASLFLLVLLHFASCVKDKTEEVEGFFSQSGHTNNWAVLVKKKLCAFSFKSKQFTQFFRFRFVHRVSGLIIVM